MLRISADGMLSGPLATGAVADAVLDSVSALRDGASTAGHLFGVDHVAVLVPDIDAALPDFVDRLGLAQVSDETLDDPPVRLVHLDAGNVDVQLIEPRGPGRLDDDLRRAGPGLHHVCFGVPVLTEALEAFREPEGGVFTGGAGRRACFLSGRSSPMYVELIEFGDGDAYGTLAPAAERILAYWFDECRRDLDRLMTHFRTDAEVVTPDAVYVGTEQIATLYRESFDAYPGLQVDVVARYAGRGSHCFEFTAVLTDPAGAPHLVEGVNVITLGDGLIARMRSYENAPRPISAGEDR